MSKIITKPRYVGHKVRIGPQLDQPQEKMVPESRYRQLEQKLNTIADESYGRGLQEGQKNGFESGLKQGKADANQVISQMQPILADITRQKNTVLKTAENDLLELALSIVGKIIPAIAERDKEVVLSTIQKSLPLLLEKSKLTLKVAPQQEQFIREHLEDILAMDSDLKEIKIEADRRVAAGGCILETSSGRVDGRLEKQLATMADALRGQASSESE